MTLTVTTEPLENRQLSMTIEVAEERIDQEMRKAAGSLAQKVRIPGFRKGRVPYHILVQFLGREAIVSEFVDELGGKVYTEAIEQEGIDPFYIASLDNIDMEQEVRFHLTVPLEPEVTLGEYRSLRVEEEEVEVDEERVQERIQKILEDNADYQDVDRPSQFGDLMTIDLRGAVLDDEGNETDTVVFDEEDWDVTPDQENPMEPAGLDEALLGLSAAEKKTFEIAWPEDSPSMYAGNTVRFSVTAHKIKSFETPNELADEMAQSVGPDFETAADLLDNIRETVLEELRGQAEFDYMDKVLEGLVGLTDIDYPPVAVEMQIDQILRNNEMRFRQMGLQGMEQFLEMSNQTLEGYRETMRESAERALRHDLALGELAKRENLDVSDEEFEEHIENVAGPPPEDADEEALKSRDDLLEMMRSESSRPLVNADIQRDKTIKRVLAIARGEEIPEPAAATPLAAETEQTDAAVSDDEAQSADPAVAEEPVAAESMAEETAES